MGLIPDNIISDVASRADMVQIVGEYVSLKRAGTAYKGLCPFHGEKTPSFNVNPSQGFFKCFGCGEGGSIFKFLMKIEGWTFPEAVRHVAARVGVEVPELDDRSAADLRKAKRNKDQYHRVMDAARAWFEANLASGLHHTATEYLDRRGVDRETAARFGLGYAPDGWSGLLDALAKKQITAVDCERAGLAVAGGRGHYDRFRDRIMFPVIDIWGKTVAFSGRELRPDPDRPGAKYINSPETRYYKKGRELFGLFTNKAGLRADGHALLVEGNFDVVTLSARGVHNVVAPLGTALTDDQVRLLARYTHKVHLAFDADKAGQAATLKALPLMMAHGFDARVVVLPEGDDPDSLVQRQGREALGEAIDRALPIMAFAVDRALDGADGAPIEEKIEALTRAGEVLATVDDKVLWRHYAEEIARRLDIRPSEVRAYIKRPERLRHSAGPTHDASPVPFAPGISSVANTPRSAGVANDGPPPGHPAAWDGPTEDAPQPVRTPLPSLEAACLQVLVDLPELLDHFVEEGGCQLLSDERIIYLIERVYAQRRKTAHAEVAILAEELTDELGDPHFLDQISALLCAERPYEPAAAESIYIDVLNALKRVWLGGERSRTLGLLAEARDGSRMQKDLLERVRELNQYQKALDERHKRKYPDRHPEPTPAETQPASGSAT